LQWGTYCIKCAFLVDYLYLFLRRIIALKKSVFLKLMILLMILDKRKRLKKRSERCISEKKTKNSGDFADSTAKLSLLSFLMVT